ncbi:MAG: hypothetical protein V4819_08220 [Verrucomicrobiota bacterium]
MTHAEKLQQIFEAALKDSSDLNQPLKRAFPSSIGAAKVGVSQAVPEPAATPAPVIEAPAKPFVVPAAPTPAANAGLSHSASAELGRLLEKQHNRKNRKRRRGTLVTLAVVLALTGGGSGWFVQSPQRVQAMKEAIRDVRSVGDGNSTVAKYQAALDKVAARSGQIEQATEKMGVSSNQDGVKDPNMDAEMLAMMGGQGKTSGQRNQMVEQAFDSKQNQDGAANEPEATAALTSDGSYR